IFIDGTGKAVVGGEEQPLATHDLVFVPAGTMHNFINTGTTPWRVLSIYAPAEHAPGTIHATKADAEAAEAHEHA
ncbi:MAG: cupin domain-containing protein, partial [Thermoleophilia bacterium]